MDPKIAATLAGALVGAIGFAMIKPKRDVSAASPSEFSSSPSPSPSTQPSSTQPSSPTSTSLEPPTKIPSYTPQAEIRYKEQLTTPSSSFPTPPRGVHVPQLPRDYGRKLEEEMGKKESEIPSFSSSKVVPSPVGRRHEGAGGWVSQDHHISAHDRRHPWTLDEESELVLEDSED